MNFEFFNLDEATRSFMVEEVEIAHNTDNIYFSKRFNEIGNKEWVSTLLEAVSHYDEHWLAYQIEARSMFNEVEHTKTPLGEYTIKHVPQNAAETLADGQFNRFYMLGLCRRAMKEDVASLVIYRAKSREQHRNESENLIGQSISPNELIPVLRSRDASLRSALLKPNSGISIRM